LAASPIRLAICCVQASYFFFTFGLREAT